KRKHHLKIDSPVGRLSVEWSACQCRRCTKFLLRTQVPNRRTRIDIVEDVSRIRAECQAVALIGSFTKWSARTAPTTAASGPSTCPTKGAWTTPAGLARVIPSSLDLGAQSKRLAQPHIERELPGTLPEINRDARIVGAGIGVEIRQLWRRWIYRRSARRKGWSVVEDGIAIQVRSRGDVEWSATVYHHERENTKAAGQRYTAAEKGSVTNIEHSSAVISCDSQSRV